VLEVEEAALPQGPPAAQVSVAAPRRVAEKAPPGRRRWLPLVIGAALLVALLVVVFVVWQPFGGEATPTAVSGAQPTPAATAPRATSPPAQTPGEEPGPGDWTNYYNTNFVVALARQGDTLWAGGDGGLVAWDMTSGSHVDYGRADGLAPGRITDLVVDHAGQLWIATDSGISRYDGQTFTHFTQADGLDSVQIQALYADGEGMLWAGSRNGELGLNYYNGDAWAGPPAPPLPVEYRNVVTLGGNERLRLFVALDDQGVALLDGETWIRVTTADGLPSDEVNAALLAGDAVWVSSDEGLGRIQLGTWEVETFPIHGIHSMQQGVGGLIWFRGLGFAVRFDPETGDWQDFESEASGLPSAQVYDTVQDGDKIWLGTYGDGVTFFDGSQWELWRTDKELGGNVIEAIRQDGDGALWFLHPGSGLSRYQPQGDAWQIFGHAEGALDWPGIHDVDSEGNVWIGEYGELLWYGGQSWQKFPPPELADVEIWAIEIGPGDFKWLVTDRGIMRHDPAADEWTTFTGDDAPVIEGTWTILAARDGNVWFGGEEGLLHYDGHRWGPPEASGEAPQYVSGLAEAPDGSLWVAADGKLVHLAGAQWWYFAPSGDGWWQKVAVGPDGRVWAGGEGLVCHDPATGEWQSYTTADGLAHHYVRSIHVTPEGVVWVGTEGGLSRFVPPD
jgi:ligand-binding sensor domain-containing protein